LYFQWDMVMGRYQKIAQGGEQRSVL